MTMKSIPLTSRGEPSDSETAQATMCLRDQTPGLGSPSGAEPALLLACDSANPCERQDAIHIGAVWAARMTGTRYKGTTMKAPGDIGWKKYRKLKSNPSRLASYKSRREPRYSHYVITISTTGRTGGMRKAP